MHLLISIYDIENLIDLENITFTLGLNNNYIF